MSKPRIYIAISQFLPVVGGAERQALAHARSLRKRGYEVTILTIRHDRAWTRRDVIQGVPVMRVGGWAAGGRERLPGPLRKLAYLTGLLLVGWTLWWRRRRYDLLCVYQLNLLALPTALACLLTRKPMVIIPRSVSAREVAESNRQLPPADGRSEPDAPVMGEDARTRMKADLDILEGLGAPVLKFTGYLLRRAGAVMVVLSSRMKQEMMVRGMALPVTLCIPNGVDATRFVPASAETPSEKRARTVICVTRLSYEKGIDVLLRAWQLVHEEVPDACLVIVGTGPLESRLKGLAETLELTDSVEFTGLQSDVRAQFHRASLAVLPSRREGMPNTVLEAMACGLPCVATRVSGSEDIIEHGLNGLLVEPEDHQGLAEGLLALLQDPALVLEYGRAARSTIEQNYSLELITDKYVSLYDKLAVTSKRQLLSHEMSGHGS